MKNATFLASVALTLILAVDSFSFTAQAAPQAAADLVADVIGANKVCFHEPQNLASPIGCTSALASNGIALTDILALAPIQQSIAPGYVRFAFLANGYSPNSTDCDLYAPSHEGVEYGILTIELNAANKIIGQNVFIHESCAYYFTSPQDAKAMQLQLNVTPASFSAYNTPYTGYALQVAASNPVLANTGTSTIGEIEFVAPLSGELGYISSRFLVVPSEKTFAAPVATYFDPVTGIATASGGLTQCFLPPAANPTCTTTSGRNGNGLLLPYTP